VTDTLKLGERLEVSVDVKEAEPLTLDETLWVEELDRLNEFDGDGEEEDDCATTLRIYPKKYTTFILF